MKVRLAVSKENYERIKRELTELGIEIDDSSELMISESNRFVDNIIVKDRISSGHIVLSSDDIAYQLSDSLIIEYHEQAITIDDIAAGDCVEVILLTAVNGYEDIFKIQLIRRHNQRSQ